MMRNKLLFAVLIFSCSAFLSESTATESLSLVKEPLLRDVSNKKILDIKKINQFYLSIVYFEGIYLRNSVKDLLIKFPADIDLSRNILKAHQLLVGEMLIVAIGAHLFSLNIKTKQLVLLHSFNNGNKFHGLIDTGREILIASSMSLYKVLPNNLSYLHSVNIIPSLLNFDEFPYYRSLFLVDDNKIGLTTAFSGVHSVNIDNLSEIRKYAIHTDNEKEKFKYQDFTHFNDAIDVDNFIYVTTSNGLHVIDKKTKQINKMVEVGDGTIIEYQDKIWFTDIKEGLFSIEKTGNRINAVKVTLFNENTTELNSRDVSVLYVDEEKSLWIGGPFGLYKYSKFLNKFKYANVSHDVDGKAVHQIIETSSNRVVIRQNDIQINQNSYSNIRVYSSYIDRELNIWLGGYKESCLIDREGNKTIRSLKDPFAQEITSIAANSNYIWYTSKGVGLRKYDRKNNINLGYENSFSPQEAVKVKYVTLASSDNIISIDNNSIIYTNLKNKSNSTIAKLKSPTANIKERDSKVYIFYNQPFITILDKSTLDVEHIKVPDVGVNCVIQLTPKERWFSLTNGQISRVKANQTIYYSKHDGLPSQGTNGKDCFASNDGLFFTSDSGLIKSTKFVNYINIKKPSLRLTSNFTGDEIKISAFPIEFTTLNSSFVSSESNKYQYLIKNMSQNWSRESHGSSIKRFEALPYGKYQLTAKATNNDNVWSKGSSIYFEVVPPFYLSDVAKMFYLIIGVVTILGLYRYRINQSEKRALELEQIVDSRTNELKEKKSQVENLLKIKDRELINISHELRTPLTLINGPVKTMLQSNQYPDIGQNLSMIARNGQRLLRMVDQLLQLERFQTRQLSDSRPINLHDAVEFVYQTFRPLALKKQISFNLKQNAQVTALFIPDSFERILINLVSNAVKYTPRGQSISIESEIKDNTYTVTVADTGEGINADYLPSIFDRYYRVHNESSEKNTGAGIGLALVKELVEFHGGAVKVSSKVGAGTCFTVSFDLSKIGTDSNNLDQTFSDDLVSIEVDEQHTQDEDLELTNQFNDSADESEKLCVLIIEDNVDMTQFIQQCLTDKFAFLTAANGQSGVDMAIEHIPDIIICDVMMPVMDGFEATKLIKENELTSHIPIIILTAKGDRDSRMQGWRSLTDEYLTKPFDKDELLLRIDSLLSIRTILKRRFALAIESPSTSEEPMTALNEVDQKFIERLDAILENHYQDDAFSIETLAELVYMSRRQLLRKVKALSELTPQDYLRNYRLVKAAQLLESGLRASDVYEKTGFNSLSYFSTCFKAKYGVTPSKYPS